MYECMLIRFSCVLLFATLWIAACQAPLPMGFSRQEYWSGLPCPPPGDLPDPGLEPSSLESSALAGGYFTTVSPGKPPNYLLISEKYPKFSEFPFPYLESGSIEKLFSSLLW